MAQIEEIYRHYRESSCITTDSRQIKENCIFFALKGDSFDGNIFAAEALKKGARLVIVDNEKYAVGPQCILVEDSLRCLQELAMFHRNKLDIPIIGLTGTNGKTSTKELIHRVLSTKYKVYSTSGNYNNHIGVPLTLLSIADDAEMAVIEMGANHIGEIAFLCRLAKPDYGLITNIGKAHLEGFGNYEGVIRAKTELYEHLRSIGGKVYVNSDDELLIELSSGMKRETYGKTAGSTYHASIVSSIPRLELKWQGFEISTQLYGEYNFDNVMASIAVGNELITSAISSYTPTNNRSQLQLTDSNTLYLDAYNANPSSMLASIEAFRKQPASNKVLILGDMLELGQDSHKEHKYILDEIRNAFKLVLLVGPEFKHVADDNFIVFNDTSEAAEWIKNNPIKNAHILVKGSRGIALENLIEYL